MEPLASLGEFFTSGKEELVGEELNSEEKQLVEEIELAITQFSKQLRSELCADISYTGKCGFANGGQWAYVRNLRKDTRVTVTIEIHSTSIGHPPRTSETTKTIRAIVKSGVRRVGHAAALLSSMSSIPSLNLTPSMSFASWRNPRSRRQDFSAHRPIL